MTKRGLRIRIALSAALAAIITFGCVQIWSTESNYRAEAKLHAGLLAYKPAAPAAAESSAAPATAPAPGGETPDTTTAPAPVYNKSIADLRERNGDAVGWLTVDGTVIDYPFVRADNNDFYLRHDIDKKSAYAGTIFMDYRCKADFSGFNTILYGHSMKNGSMFHDLIRFGDKSYFDSHTTGTIYLENRNISLNIFAFLVINPIDLMVFQTPAATPGAQLDNYMSYIRTHARYVRDVKISAADHLVTLSTCDYEFSNARAVLVGKIEG